MKCQPGWSWIFSFYRHYDHLLRRDLNKGIVRIDIMIISMRTY